ncbi:hypothetical protein FQN54_001129 [Arachnomyces sp. PD_36]|nr:hypothetical protein FQN54_001129 [Arachnomyces sp. PD_36]
MTTPQLHGHCDEAFAPVRKLFETNLLNGSEVGASIVVNIDGKTVLDLWGGYADSERTRPWTEDTIANVWSLSKTVTNLAALILVDRGLLDLNEKVAKYWPEFGVNGKEGIEVRHILAHTSGVSGWEKPIVLSDIYDLEASTARLAEQAPWWEPGTASGYHAQNQGHLVGELVRRVTGKSLSQFIVEEISHPTNADFRLGASESDLPRIAEIIPPDEPIPLDAIKAAVGEDSIAYRTFTSPISSPTAPNTPEWRAAELGALNGHGNARSLNRILSSIALGNTPLLSQPTISRIFEEQSNNTDLVLGIPVRFGNGFALPSPAGISFIPEGRVCFWGGWGGSVAIMDLDRRMTITYVMNKMSPGTVGSERSEAYVRAVYGVVGGL